MNSFYWHLLIELTWLGWLLHALEEIILKLLRFSSLLTFSFIFIHFIFLVEILIAMLCVRVYIPLFSRPWWVCLFWNGKLWVFNWGKIIKVLFNWSWKERDFALIHVGKEESKWRPIRWWTCDRPWARGCSRGDGYSYYQTYNFICLWFKAFFGKKFMIVFWQMQAANVGFCRVLSLVNGEVYDAFWFCRSELKCLKLLKYCCFTGKARCREASCCHHCPVDRVHIKYSDCMLTTCLLVAMRALSFSCFYLLPLVII